MSIKINNLLLFLIVLTSLCLEINVMSEDLVDDSAVVFMYHRFGEDKYPSTNVKLS